MRRHRILSILSVIALPLITTVCGEPGAAPAASRTGGVAVPPPDLAITDSRDGGGIAHFFFLEPVDRRPKGRRLGPADRSLEGNLALEICQWMGDHCAQPLLARYTKTSGVGKERLQLDDDDDYYKVRWYTSKFASIDAGETYRITVLAAGITLGTADVKIIRRNRDAKKVDRDDFVALKDDEGLTIRFYIERCGVFVIPATGGSATPCASGSVIATANQAVGIIVPEGAAIPNTNYTVTPMDNAPGDAGLAGGPFAFGPSGVDFAQPITLSMSFAPARLPNRVPETSLGAYEMKDGAWRRAGPATVDADHDRVQFDIAHFSQYAVLAPVASVSLTLPATPLTVGGSGDAVATVKDAADRVLEHRALEWSVFPAGIVAVDANGKLTGISAGEATVTVTSEGQRTAASMTVGGAKAASVAIGGGSDAPLIVGQTRQLSATARDASGAVIPGGTVTWSSSSDANASVDATGLVTAKAAGQATITATVAGVSGTSLVNVQPPPVTAVAVTSTAIGPLDIGATRQLTAAVYSGTTQLLGRVVTWASSDANLASVDANGLVTAKAKGSVKISATSEGVVGTIDIAVQLPTITSVAVTPATSTILVGATQQLAAAAMAGSVAQTGRTVAWKSSNEAIASVDANGLVSGKTPGDATISATVEGVTGTANVTVNPLPVTSVVVQSAASGPLNVGATRQLTASAYNGTTPLTGRAIAWSSSDANIATIDATGLVTGRAVGAVKITATVEGIAGTIDITVQLPPITSVVVTPPSSSILVGGTQQLSAAALAGTVPQSGRAVTWKSSNVAFATVDATGLVTGKAPGDVTISATVDGITGTAAVSVNPLPVTSVVVSSAVSGPLDIGATRQLTASAFNGATALPGRAIAWSSSDPNVASVDANGLVTGTARGSVTISATSEGIVGTIGLTVQPPPITSVVVTPPSSTILVGGTQQLSAAALAGTVAQSGRAITWKSSNDATASVDVHGLVTGNAPGDVTISATVEGITGSATVSVNPLPVTSVVVAAAGSGPLDIGATRQLNASAFNGTTALTGRSIAWSSSDANVASVDGSGLVTGRAVGSAKISATVEGIAGTIDITVQLPPITSVVVTPPSSTILVGGTQKLAAAAMAGSVAQSGRAVTWKSSDATIASVDATGLVTGNAPGDVTISATVDGVTGSAAVSVRPLPVTSVAVSATESGPLNIGATRQLSAAVFNGTTQLAGRTVTWSSSDANVLSVDASGLVTAKVPGNATISATSEGVSGSMDLTAQLPPITSVAVTPQTAELIVGGTQQFSASALAGSAPQIGRAVVWTSSNDAVVTIDASGLAIAKGAGTASITATIEGVAGSASVSVKLPPITAVNVTPQSATILVGGTQQLAAVAMSGADPQPGRAATWASSNDAVATVDGNGLVTARAPGIATVSATVDGISGGSAITVNPVVVPVTSVAVTSPAIGPLAVGSTRQLTAAAYNGATQLFGRAVAWSSSDPNVMSVDGNGLVTAVSAGRATITALIEGISGTNDISTQGLVFGPWRMGIAQLATLYSGSLRVLDPVGGFALLDSARAAGLRLIVTPVQSREKFKDPVTGRFDLQLWKYQLDRFNGFDFTPYIQSGTIIGIFIIDEPRDPTNWVNKKACMTDGISPTCLLDANGAIIPDPGEPVSYADIDAAAAYAKSFFPGVPLGVGSRPSELEAGAPYQNLNFGFAQYTTKKKDANGNALTASGFVTYEVAAAKRAGLATILSINVMAGNAGAPVLPSQLRSWGTMMANEPYACALTMWKWDLADVSAAEPYNSWWNDPINIAALRDVAAAAGKRPPGVCRAH